MTTRTEAMDKLQTYVDMGNDEWSEAMTYLINMREYYSSHYDEKFVAAIDKEIEDNLKMVEGCTEIVEHVEMIPEQKVVTKELVWY